jgi:hypothetical protein
VLLRENLEDLAESAQQISGNVQPDSAAAVLDKRLQISRGLSFLQRTECITLARDGDISGVLGRDLNEDTVVGAALVQLSRRMQKPRAVAERRRGPELFPDASADTVEQARGEPRGDG